MGTARLHLARLGDPGRRMALTGFTVAWVCLSVVTWAGLVALPQERFVRFALLFAVPAGLIAVAVLRRTADPDLNRVTAVVAVLAAALVGGPAAAQYPYLVALVPGIVVIGFVVGRWPVAALALGFALASFYGSLEAFTGLSGGQATDIALIGLWVVAIARRFDARREPQLVSFGVIAIAVYLLLTLTMALTASDPGFALRDFRVTGWHIAALIPVAYMGLSPKQLETCTRAAVVVALIGGAYATLRWAIGPAEAEEELLSTTGSLIYNSIAGGEQKVQGALPNGQELGLWAATAIPFLVACTIAWRGLFAVVAACAVPLCVIALLGSGQRSGVVAASVGVTVVLVVHQLARGFHGPRLGITLGAAAAFVVGVLVIFPAVVDTPAKVERYQNILQPERDQAFQDRIFKWRDAFEEVETLPLGRGVGQAGTGAASQRFYNPTGVDVDNSYVKIAYEQGALVMLLFMGALLVLGIELVRFGIWTGGTQGAAAAMGAAGALAALGIEFMGNLFVTSLAGLMTWLIVGFGVAHMTSMRER